MRHRPISTYLTALALLAASATAQAQLLGSRTEATSCASAIGGSVTASHISIVCGVPPEVLDALVRSRSQPLEDLVAAHRETIGLLKQNLDLNERQIRAALHIVGEANVAPEQLAAKLLEIVQRVAALQPAAASRPDDTARIAALKGETRNAIAALELERADQLLATIARLQDETLDRLALSRAETSAQRGDVALTRLRYREAAEHFAEAGARVPANRADVRVAYLDHEADAWHQQGAEFGDNAAALNAIAKSREALTSRPRERVPLDWAATQNNLGNALWTLGERESGTVRLEQAVEAYRAALQERTRERVPLDWARTQNNLGIALRTLGERESGTVRLEQAVTAFREALQEQTRERVPLDWATTQNNLGNALWTLGERESGTARLEQAVEAYRAALQEWTRERVPLDWAVTQNNLGTALSSLGQREGSTARLEQAVEAYRAALQEWTRERVPLDWALSQSSLGNALLRLGQRESGTVRLEQAVEAYRAALQERTRQRVPLEWAMSIGNQGVALMLLADRRAEIVMAETALTQIEAAYAAMRDGAHAPFAAFYARQLPAARAVVERLKKK